MPHYDYKCEKCDYVFEVFHKMTENPEVFCPKCNSSVKRLFGGGGGIIFKGSGFYKTDYASSKSSTDSESSKRPVCSCSADKS